MSRQIIPIAFPAEVADDIRYQAGCEGDSVSGWIRRAAVKELRRIGRSNAGQAPKRRKRLVNGEVKRVGESARVRAGEQHAA